MKHKILLLLSLILILLTATTGTLSAWASINLPNVVAMEFFSDYAEEVEGHSIYSSETITDFAGNVYKLCVISPKGYLVMCSVPFSVTDTGYVFVELDEENNNPYNYFTERNITGDKKYVGPGEYYIQSGNVIYGTDGSNFQASSERHNVLINASNQMKSSLTAQGSSVTLGNRTYINNYQYFHKLKTIWQDGDYHTPINMKKTCGFNALAILLGYYRVAFDKTILPDDFMQPIGDEIVTNQNLSFDSIGLNSIDTMPTVNDSLLVKLVRYCYPLYQHGYGTPTEGQHWLFGGYPAGSITLKNTLDAFFAEYHTQEYKALYSYTPYVLGYSSVIKGEINAGRPVILSMLYLNETDVDTGETEEIWGHNVIAYGYKGSTYIVFDVNTGGNKIINCGLIGASLTFRYNGTHTHSTDMRFENKGCYGTFCPCGQYTVCEHNVVNDDCSCVSCGIYLHDFHINLLHFTSTYHYKVCSKCNYSAAEEHIMRPKPSGLYCEICGYDTTSSGEITLGTGEHTH